MEQTNTEMAETPAKRPGFLTALCILSYIGSGLWALFSLIGIFASSWIVSLFVSSASQSTMDEMSTQGFTPEQMEKMQKGMDALSGLASLGGGALIAIFVVSLVLAFLSIFGAAKMWNLKKVGFWIYASVNIIMIIFGFMAGGLFGPILGVAFIAMYAANLKYMS